MLSCSQESDEDNIAFELLPVSEVMLPTIFTAGMENNIQVKFLRPTGCHAFNRFYFEIEGSSATIAVESTIFKTRNSNCPDLQNNNVATQVLKFNPDHTGEYILKFWKGKDNNGVDVFLTYTIVVQ